MRIPILCHYLLFALLFIAIVFQPVKIVAQDSNTNIISTIVIDPGHGGKDPGNLGTKRYKVTEKDIALDISLLVGKYLNQAFPELKVLYTRDDDSFVELKERTAFANRNKADLFISIHCNANESKRPIGADTWVMGTHKNEANLRVAQKENASILLEKDYENKYGDFDPNSPETYLALSLRQNVHLTESLLLAKYVQDEFKTRVGRVDRGVRQSGFYVISFTTMPSILIETGFLTNPGEEDFLNSTKGKEYMASAIYRAIKKYIAQVEDIPVSQLKKVGETENTVSFDDEKLNKEEEVNQEIAEVENVIVSDLSYKIQLFVSSEKKELVPDNFNGLTDISVLKIGSLYKYYFSSVSTYEKAQEMTKKAQQKGYNEAFVVSFKGDNRIDLQEALTLERNSEADKNK